MAWSTIREATAEDHEKLERRAEAFMRRHKDELALDEWATDEYLALWTSNVQALEAALDFEIEHYPYREHPRYLQSLWRQVVKRALGHHWAEGIAYGYVGFHTD